jgi:nucleoid-associated protein YgaU
VRPGDSLWRIAANHLGRGTFDAAIARAWPIIYQANRDVIGDDPGFIRPGQRLLIPAEVNP